MKTITIGTCAVFIRRSYFLTQVLRRSVILWGVLALPVQGGTTFEVVAPIAQSATDPYYPVAGLIQAANGAFYGTTMLGGSNNFGTVFRVTTGGLLTILVNFDKTNGYEPQAPLVQL